MRPPQSLLACLAAGTLLVPAAGPVTGARPARVEVLDGAVRVVAVDDAVPRTLTMTDVDGHLVGLHWDRPTAPRTGDRVRLTVERRPGSVAVRGAEPLQGGSRALAATGAHTLTVLPVYWTAPDPAAGRGTLAAAAAGAGAYWSAQSGGRLTISPAVRNWARIADPGTCDPTRLANAALAANGLRLPSSAHDHVMVYFPTRTDCGGWAGLGEVGGSLSWDNGEPLTEVLAHEVGHNLGLGHANTQTCTSSGVRVTLSASCRAQEYRDYADVMGAALDRPPGTLNAALADRLGLATVVTVAPGTRAAVDLAPLGRVSGTRAVRIRAGRAWVYADYRPAVAPDVRMPAWSGVQLHLLPDGPYPASRLLDGRPDTPAPFTATALPPGVPWTVPGSGLTLTVTATTATGAHVVVEPAASGAGTAVPRITSPVPGASVATSATVRWESGADAVVRLLVDGVARAVSPSASRAGSLTVSGLPEGRHRLAAQALDADGQPVTTSAAVTVTVDGTPPAMPDGLGLASGVLSWRPAADGGSGTAGYLVALAGDTARPVSATSLRVGTAARPRTWWVAAVDRAGNVSPAARLTATATTSRRARGR